jgi:hypothetical protein
VVKSKYRYIVTDEIRQKMRESSARRWAQPEERQKISQANRIELPLSDVKALYELGLSVHKIGIQFGVKGDTIHRFLRRSGIRLRRPGQFGHQWGPDHKRWKGSGATYTAFHTRIWRRRGKPKQCSVCGTNDPKRTYDWANLTGRYDDPEDYKRMCRSCHRRYDISRRSNAS